MGVKEFTDLKRKIVLDIAEMNARLIEQTSQQHISEVDPVVLHEIRENARLLLDFI
ncbi:MAG: hypothetical protein E6X17_06025 [Sporomusaceae bacterium]|nr:hypothetical protein [Sporomusaceae bacterium]